MSDMLKEQINSMAAKEIELQELISTLTENLAAKKKELRIISKAKEYNIKLLEKFESGDLNDEQ